jgi:hypothetical protein
MKKIIKIVAIFFIALCFFIAKPLQSSTFYPPVGLTFSNPSIVEGCPLGEVTQHPVTGTVTISGGCDNTPDEICYVNIGTCLWVNDLMGIGPPGDDILIKCE